MQQNQSASASVAWVDFGRPALKW